MSVGFLNRLLFVFAVLIIFSPRMLIDGISIPFSGLDFSPFIIVFHIVIALLLHRQKSARYLLAVIQLTIVKSPMGKYYLFFLIPMFFFPFIYFFVGGLDWVFFIRSMLQFYRHFAVFFVYLYFAFYVLLSANNFRTGDSLRHGNDIFFEYCIFLSMMAGAFFSFLIAIGIFPKLSPASDLTATSIFENESSMIRFEGFSGSPTPFAVVCLIGLVYLFLLQKKYSLFSGWFYYISFLVFSGCILFTFSKSVLVFWFVFLCSVILDSIKLGLIPRLFFGSVVVTLFTVVAYFLVNDSLVMDLVARALVSADERLYIYKGVISGLVDSPVRWIIGSGWKSSEVGAHNEQLEIVLAFGFPIGVLCMLSLFVSVYKFISSVGFDKYSVFICMSMFVFSLFQEIYWNPSVMLVFLVFTMRIVHYRKLYLEKG